MAARRFHKTCLKKPESEIDPALKPKGARALALMDRRIRDRSHFVADYLTLVDIAQVAYTSRPDEGAELRRRRRAPTPRQGLTGNLTREPGHARPLAS